MGPVLAGTPDVIRRSDGQDVPIPDAYFCVTFDPFRYPWDRLSNVNIAAFLIPQDAPPASKPQDYLTEVREIEERTGLTFVPGWDAQPVRVTSAGAQNRLVAALDHAHG